MTTETQNIDETTPVDTPEIAFLRSLDIDVDNIPLGIQKSDGVVTIVDVGAKLKSTQFTQLRDKYPDARLLIGEMNG